MSIISWMNKLINEHGSASIMKERIALKDDQIAIKDKKIAELEAQLMDKARKDNTAQHASSAKPAQKPAVSSQAALQPSENEKINDALGYDILGRLKNKL